MLPLARFLTPDETYWLSLHPGLSLSEGAEGQGVRIEIACRHLQDDGHCAVFGRPERPQMCSDLPEWPGHLDGLPGGAESCAYKFEAVPSGSGAGVSPR